MSFRVNARMILELGAELISSDGIALYELIKNGIDAGSRRVRIDVTVLILRSTFDALVEEIETNPGSLKGTRDAVVKAAQLGAEDGARLGAALNVAASREEMKLNLRGWYERNNYIRVRDTGHGMTKEDLNSVFLEIGTRSRLRVRSSELNAGRTPPLGGKGVGRLSTMRLGDRLVVRTSKSSESKQSELEIDWTLFDHGSDALLEEIRIEARDGAPKKDPSSSGTDMLVQGLRADWTKEKLQQIAFDEFARLVDPWAPRGARQILGVRFNGESVEIPVVEPTLLDRAHGYCSANYRLEAGAPIMTGRVDYKLRGKEKTFSLNATEILSAANTSSITLLRNLGPFEMEMWWFNRGLITKVNGYPDAAELRQEIRKWAGGLMLFRDGYRVNPYGGTDDDWLELEKEAFKSKGYKLNRQQIVGRVLITWRNDRLQDQTNREGLVATAEKAALVALLRHILLNVFKAFIQRQDDAAQVTVGTTLETISERVASTEAAVREKIAELERSLSPEHHSKTRAAVKLVGELARHVDEVRAYGEKYADEREQLVYLAGVGLMVEFVLHELDRATTGTLRTLKDVDRSRLDPRTAAAVQVLTDQLDTLNKRVANLEAMGTVRRQTKTEFDVFELVQRTVAARQGQLERHGIAATGSFRSSRKWRVRANPGMFVQVIDNLLANSTYWLIRQAIVEPDLEPFVSIDVDPDEATVTVTDNGPGVDPAMADEIFQPFVTRKPAGEGRGLGLYISREVARNQGWSVDVARTFGVRPDRYNTFVLNLGAKAAR